MSAFIQGKGDVFGPIGAVAGNIPVFDGASGKIIKDGKAAPAGTVVGTTDTQTLANKTLDDPTIQPVADTPLYRPSGVVYVKRNDTNAYMPGLAWNDVAVFSMPANLLSRYCDVLRMTTNVRYMQATTVARILQVSFGGTTVYNVSRSSAGPATWQLIVTVLRNSDGTQRVELQSTTNLSALMDTPIAVTANLATVLDFKVMAYTNQGGGDFYHVLTFVEFLPAPLVTG